MIRRIATVLVLLAITSVTYGSWYLYRSLTYPFLVEEVGTNPGVVFGALEWSMGPALLGVLCAGFAGAVLGARIALGVACLGAGLSVAAIPLVAAPAQWDPNLLIIAMCVAAFWQAWIGPCLMAAAADTFQGEWAGLRAAMIALIYGALNGAAVAANLSSQSLADQLGAGTLITVSSALIASVSLGAIVLLLVPADADAPPDPAEELHPPAVGLSFAVLAVAAIPVGVNWYMTEHWYQVAQALVNRTGGMAGSGIWYMLNPVVIVLLTPLLAMVMAVVAFYRLRIPELAPAGVGLLLAAASSAMMTFDPNVVALQWFAAAIVVGSVGELLIGTFVVSRLLSDVHWRLTLLMAATWSFVTRAIPMTLNLLGLFDLSVGMPHWALWANVTLLAATGVVMLAVAWPAHRFAAIALPEPDDSDPDEHPQEPPN